MKKLHIIGLVFLLPVVIAATYAFVKPGKKTMLTKNDNGFVVLELFTSEGCSSCPAADKVIADLETKNMKNVFILSYHVDYWDRLGWKDLFSNPEFSERQRRYAAQFASESVYTPQVVVNGTEGFVGSDKDKVYRAISGNLQKAVISDVEITTSAANGQVTVSYTVNEKEPVLLNMALVQPEATSVVKRGENQGRTLHHVDIVRGLKTLEAKGKGIVTIDIPKDLAGSPVELLAFTQQKNDLKILGAAKSLVGK